MPGLRLTCSPATGEEHKAPSIPPLGASYRSVVLIVLDGLGIGSGGAAPDTLGHVACLRQLSLPNLAAMGLADLSARIQSPARSGSSARLVPLSPGKDTLTGHWELAGLVTELDLRTFPHGFPPDFMDALSERLGRGLIGGLPASGTEVIDRLGQRHLRTGELIVYTSADSVVQIAAHEDVVSATELYELCRAARALAAGPWLVGRVIARPFRGSPGGFVRTSRRDFSLEPPGRTVLEAAEAAGVEVIAVGKISDVFAGRGVTRSLAAGGNHEVMQALSDLGPYAADNAGPRRLVFANLNDFDSLYGHRRDAAGFADALEEFDRFLPQLAPPPGCRGLLAVTGDHGCDPTHPGTDHTREDVPLLVSGACWPHAHLGSLMGLTAVAGLVSAAFGLEGFNFWPRKACPGNLL